MTESEIEALASALTRELLTSPVGEKADTLTQYSSGRGILATMSEAAAQQKIAKAIRHHLNGARS